MFSTASRSAAAALRSSVRPSMAVTSAARRAPLAPLMSVRGYAEATSEKLSLSLILPHAALFEGEVTQVNINSTSGEMGILAAHVPSIEQLAPGLLEVFEASGSKKWFGK